MLVIKMLLASLLLLSAASGQAQQVEVVKFPDLEKRLRRVQRHYVRSQLLGHLVWALYQRAALF